MRAAGAAAHRPILLTPTLVLFVELVKRLQVRLQVEKKRESARGNRTAKRDCPKYLVEPAERAIAEKGDEMGPFLLLCDGLIRTICRAEDLQEGYAKSDKPTPIR